MHAQISVVKDLIQKLKAVSDNKDSNLKEFIQTLERNIELSEAAARDPLAAIREEPTNIPPGESYISIGRRVHSYLKVKLEEAKLERNEMQHAVESEAFCVKTLLLLMLIISVGMLLVSYKIDHG